MEALLGLASAALFFALVLLRPGFGVAMALCLPMIHPAIGSGASFLGPVVPGLLFSAAMLRAMFCPPHREQLKLCFVDMAMIGWIAYLPITILLDINDRPDVVMESSLLLVYMGFSFYASVRLLCLSAGVGDFTRSFASGMVVFGVFITVVALARQEQASEYVTRLTIGNTYIPLSIYITLALLSAIFMLFFMKDQISRLERLFLTGSAPLLFYGMLLCNTRGVVVALVLTAFLLLVRALFSSRLAGGLGRRAAVGLIIAAIAAVAAAAAFPDVWTRMGSRFGEMSSAGVEGSDASRIELYAHAWKMFADSPIFGHGLGTFDIAMRSYPHNLVLEVMAGTGLVGLCLFALVAGGSVMVTLQYQSVYSLFINALVVFMLLEAMLSLSFWMHKNLFAFMAMAVAHHLYQLAPKGRPGRLHRRRRRRRPSQGSLPSARLV